MDQSLACTKGQQRAVQRLIRLVIFVAVDIMRYNLMLGPRADALQPFQHWNPEQEYRVGTQRGMFHES